MPTLIEIPVGYRVCHHCWGLGETTLCHGRHAETKRSYECCMFFEQCWRCSGGGTVQIEQPQSGPFSTWVFTLQEKTFKNGSTLKLIRAGWRHFVIERTAAGGERETFDFEDDLPMAKEVFNDISRSTKND